MVKSAIQSFSYDIRDAAIVMIAEERAKEQGKSFSKYIMELIKNDLEKKEKNSPGMPILSKEYRSGIHEYSPDLYKNEHERRQLWRYIDSCDNDHLTSLAIQITETRKKIISRRSRNPFRF